MSMPIYCTGTFVGQRIFDELKEDEIIFTLCFTPTKEYPSVFGGSFNRSSSSNGIAREASMIELIDGISHTNISGN
jgi:hypothetical protein